MPEKRGISDDILLLFLGGKLSSACGINLDIALSPKNENTLHLSSSSSQDSTGLADDSNMEQDDSNLTLHSSAMTDNEDDIFEGIYSFYM